MFCIDNYLPATVSYPELNPNLLPNPTPFCLIVNPNPCHNLQHRYSAKIS